MYCYCIEKSEIQKQKGLQIKMAPTLKIFGVVSRFLYSGGWQVCVTEMHWSSSVILPLLIL